MTSKKYFHIACLSFCVLMSCTGSKSDKKEMTNEESNIQALLKNAVSENSDDKRGYIVKVGDMAPDFEMTLSNGESIKLSSLKGKVVMLQFTASWCGICRKEMPYIEKEIWNKHKNNPDFALYGIDREEPLEKINELIEKTGVTYPIGLDPDAEIFTLYAEERAGITRNVIIDREGKIVMLTRLFDMDEFSEMVEVIDSLVNNPSN